MKICAILALTLLAGTPIEAQFCGPLVAEPRWLLRQAGTFFLGTVQWVADDGRSGEAGYEIEVVWRGDLDAGELICLRLPHSLCETPGVTVGRRYYVWSLCSPAELLRRATRDGAACVAYPLTMERTRFYSWALESTGPAVTRHEAAKRLVAWQSDQLSSAAFYDWVEYVILNREASDRGAGDRSVLEAVLDDLRSWLILATRQPGEEECRIRLAVAGDCLNALSNAEPTTEQQSEEWRLKREEISRRIYKRRE